jgi:ADP-ribosyl-[dinitrogen reductase] hydrolase
VARSLEAALWAIYHSDSFEEGCLKVVNLGDDADTTGQSTGNWLARSMEKKGFRQACSKNWRSAI